MGAQMTTQVDIVRKLITRLLEAQHREGTLTESIALEVERSFRREYAGESFYVKKLPVQMADKQAAVTEAYLRGDHPEEIVSAEGISRRSLYRYLKR